MIRSVHYYVIMLLAPLFLGCSEEFNFENETFDFILVIDATLTDEMKIQTIYINRVHRFEEDGPNKVTGATVLVTAGDKVYEFKEEIPGTYNATERFAAQPDIAYTLSVTTKNGNQYSSTPVTRTAQTTMDALYAKRETNDDGIDGISINVDSFDPSNSSQYYRFEFEETFKIVAPLWRDQDAYIILAEECLVGLRPRSRDKITCYRSEESNFVNVATTIALNEDRLEGELVRFLSNQDYRISHRYSILVRQFVISERSYVYWDSLGDLIDKESLFSQTQAGFVAGNIKSTSNAAERVVGFFDVSTVTSKRIYFNYTDFYPNEPLPPYATPCTPDSPAQFDAGGCGPLIPQLLNNSSVYLEDNIDGGGFFNPGPFIMVPRACGDCTALGQTEPPEFWKE